MADATNDFRCIDDATMAARGWAAWSRDDDGLICTSFVPFKSRDEWQRYVTDETARGFRVFYPDGPLKMEATNV